MSARRAPSSASDTEATHRARKIPRFGWVFALALVVPACGDDAGVDSGLDAMLDAGLDARPGGPWRSVLFPVGWSPATTDPEGRFLHDFSYAGYRHGDGELGQDPPAVSFDVVGHGADPSGATDSTAAIQAAIDAASSGGGVVSFPDGLYRVDGTLRVAASRVVLRGEGPDRSRVFFPRVEGMSYRSHVTFAGEATTDLDLPLVDDAAPRETAVFIADAADLTAGDDVDVGFVITPAYVEAHAMTGIWTAFNDAWQPIARRTVVAVDRSTDPVRVELDVPLRSGALRDDGASVRRVRGMLREVGIEGLGLSNAVSPDVAWAENQVHVLEMTGVADAWIRDVASFSSPAAPTAGEGAGAHLASGGILVQASRRVTIADTRLSESQNRGPNGNGYLFEIRTSNEVLTRDSSGHGGRHNFIQNWGFGTSGCVWLRVSSSAGRALSARGSFGIVGASEFHHSLATANLIDSSVLDDGWLGVNRLTQSTGAGHTATENVFWGVSGDGTIRSFQWGWGYVIGTSPGLAVVTEGVAWEQVDTEPLDFVEGLGRGAELEPSSLYEAQLARRLGR